MPVWLPDYQKVGYKIDNNIQQMTTSNHKPILRVYNLLNVTVFFGKKGITTKFYSAFT